MALRPLKSHCCCLRFILTGRRSLSGNGICLLARLGMPRLVMAQSTQKQWIPTPILCAANAVVFDKRSFMGITSFNLYISVILCEASILYHGIGIYIIVWIQLLAPDIFQLPPKQPKHKAVTCSLEVEEDLAGRATCNKGCVAVFDVLDPWKPIWLGNELLLEVLKGFLLGIG